MNYMLAIFLTIQIGFSQIQKRSFEFFSSDDGLSQALVTSVIEDEYGFLWLGTKDGLNRYDGYTFKTFYQSPKGFTALNSSFINDLELDTNGMIWVATTLGFNQIDPLRFEIKRFTNGHILSQFNSSEILKTYLAENKHLWFIADKTIYDYFQGEIKSYKMGATDKVFPMDIVFEDDDKDIWVLFNNGSLKSISNKTTIKFRNFNYDYNKDIKAGIVKVFSNKDKLMIGTKDELYIFNFGKITKRLKISIPTYFVEDEFSKTSFIGGYENLYSFEENDKNASSIFDDSEFIGFESVHKDYLHNIWFGTRGFGVLKYDAHKYLFKLHDLQVPGVSHIYRIYEHNDDLWLESHNKVVRYNRYKSTKEVYTLPKNNSYYDVENKINLTETTINDMIAVDDRLFLSTELGLHEFDFKNKKIVKRNDFIINKFLKIDDKSYWASNSEGLFEFDPRSMKLKQQKQLDMFKGKYINYFNYSNNQLWAADIDTLYHYNFTNNHLSKFYNISDAGSLSKGRILSIFIDSKEIVWIGTWGGGLNKYEAKTKSFKNYSTDMGLPNNVIYGILEDSFAKFWISTNRGIFRFDPESETFKHFNKEDGLQSSEFNTDSYLKSKSGEMFFGGVKGLNSFIPEDLEFSKIKPNLYLSALRIDNKSLAEREKKLIFNGEAFEFNYDENFLSFEFTLLSYIDTKKNFYRYRLKGFDENWSKESNRNFVSYTNIPPGDYKFELEAKTREMQNFDSKLSISITILNPFWAELYNQIIFIIFMIAVISYFVKRHYRNVRKQNILLEKEVEKRTAEVNSNYKKLSKFDNIVRHISSEIKLDQLILRILEETEIREKIKSAILFKDIGNKEFYKIISIQGDTDIADEENIFISDFKKNYLDGMVLFSNSIYINNRYTADKFLFLVNSSSNNIGYLFLDCYEKSVFEEEELHLFKDLEEHINLALVKMIMVDELQYLNDRKDEFLGIASHDLRNPLHSIAGYSEVIKLAVVQYKDTKLNSYIDKISSIVSYMANIIEELISISAIETGKMNITKKMNSIKKLINESLDYFTVSSNKKNISIHFHDNNELSDFLFDYHRLQEVIDNLISNAIKYTRAGGTIDIYLEQLDDNVVITIEDNGLGFSDEDKKIVFKEFKKLSAKPTGEENSTGFGLAIVKKIIDKHGGSVSLDMEKEDGARFFIKLPFVRE